MKATIIYAHPNPKSFNHAIKDTVENNLKRKDITYTTRDLYKLNFEPVLKPEDFIAIQKGDYLPDVKQEQNHIKNSDTLIIIHPIWWYSMPAILKGYIDRVFAKGFAYAQINGQIKGLLENKKVLIFNTLGESKEVCEKNQICQCIRKTIDSIFEFCGMEVLEHKFFFSVPYVTDSQRKEMLKEVETILDTYFPQK
ncbi:MAG: NAD(P)H-dependent oxidoreductase [Aquificae bacterium]|nr:NAD(P)H-dependent oxidoreductase [Aquificota bacterium]